MKEGYIKRATSTIPFGYQLAEEASSFLKADDRNSLSGSLLRRFRLNPTFFKAAIDDGSFNVFDGDGGIINAKNAGAFAGRRTNAAGKFWEIVRLVQPI